MYKVFFVDDEIVIREGVRDSIKWENTNFILSGEAADGEMALPIIQEIKPDILITDIKMPFMDGLQLSSIVKRSMPWIKIIILSGHDEFSYAKEAINVGVTEYILKPVNSTDLINSLNNVALQIEDEKREREKIENIKNLLNNNIPLLREKFLNELTIGLINPMDAIEKCSQFNIKIISKYYVVEVIEAELINVTRTNADYLEFDRIDSIISKIVDSNQDIIRFKRKMEETILILKGDSFAALEDSAYIFAQSIKYDVERNAKVLINISIGSVRERIQGIVQSLTDADTAKGYKSLMGNFKILGIKDINSGGISKDELVKFGKINTMDYLKRGNKNNIDEFLENYIKYLDDSDFKSLILTYYSFMDIVMSASKFILELGGEIDAVLPEIEQLNSILSKNNFIEKFKENSKNILEKVIDFRDSRMENKYVSIISIAKEYINKNFADTEISLNLVSSVVNMSPSHFSTIFSQETGETFIDCLTRIRIEKAKEFLNTTHKKSSEIAYSIGYNDPHYFSYLFKKITGITPIEFRKGKL